LPAAVPLWQRRGRGRHRESAGGNTSTMSSAASLPPVAPGRRQAETTRPIPRAHRRGRERRGAPGVNETRSCLALRGMPAAIAQLEPADAAHGAPHRFPKTRLFLLRRGICQDCPARRQVHAVSRIGLALEDVTSIHDGSPACRFESQRSDCRDRAIDGKAASCAGKGVKDVKRASENGAAMPYRQNLSLEDVGHGQTGFGGLFSAIRQRRRRSAEQAMQCRGFQAARNARQHGCRGGTDARYPRSLRYGVPCSS
jgi:hypothetical protein